MSIARRVLLALLGLVLLAVIAMVAALNLRPSLDEWAHLRMTDSGDTRSPTPPLRVTFLGVSTLLFDDGEVAIMTDGFFSRPGIVSVATRIAPDSALIAQSLARLGIQALAAVIPVHSHYDHAMDAGLVARLTGARLVGSPSTANIGRGAELPENQLVVPGAGEVLTFGRFRVRLLPSGHVPSPVLMPGEITSPLTPPARTRDYRLGGAFSVLIEHDGRSILVQGSAGFAPDALRDVRADVVYLGVATLGKQSAAYREDFWRETVARVGARRIIAIHWDDFLRPLSAPLVPMPYFADDIGGTMRFLLAKQGTGGPEVRLPLAWVPVDPFAGLSPAVRAP